MVGRDLRGSLPTVRYVDRTLKSVGAIPIIASVICPERNIAGGMLSSLSVFIVLNC